MLCSVQIEEKARLIKQSASNGSLTHFVNYDNIFE